MRASTVLVALALATGTAATAQAASILPGNTTTVTLTSASALASLGVSVAPLGSATISAATPPVASFPITGGTANGGALLIQHNGSGLELFATAKPTTNIELTNFLVDTANAVIDANVAVNMGTPSASQVAVFSIGTGLSLTLTNAGLAAINSTFGTTPLTTSTVIGTAATNPIIATPEPASVAVLGLGLAGLLAARRRARG